jgi:hypothetical protein
MILDNMASPQTTLSDCLGMLGISLVAGAALHLLRARLGKVSGEADVLAHSTGQAKTEVLAAIKSFHWTPAAFLLSWLPLLGMSMGNIACSLWRDAGHSLYPWPMVGVSVLVAAIFAVTVVLRHRMLKRRLVSPPVKSVNSGRQPD